MIQPGSTQKSSVRFRVLSDDQIEEIKRAAFEVMSKVGYRVHHEGARKMLKQAGALVRGEIVKVPEHVVLECLRKRPGDRPASAEEIAERLRGIDFPTPWSAERARAWWAERERRPA